jgi:orotidine-5'-phosphate decarboxylase
VEAVERKQSQLVVGLDPFPDRVRDIDSFCRTVIDAVAPYAVAVKPQSAFFELHGWEGVRTFEAVCDYARAAGLLVVADVKRGDISTTAEAYAEAVLRHADAATVNPYLGGDSIEPYLRHCRAGKGIFVLVKTSNAGGRDFQDARLEDGRRLWELVAEHVDRWGSDLIGDCGSSSVGVVMGATYPEEVGRGRELLPRSPFLLLGVGAQGATVADCAPAFATGIALVSTSRSVIFADDPGAEAERLAREVWNVAQAA